MIVQVEGMGGETLSSVQYDESLAAGQGNTETSIPVSCITVLPLPFSQSSKQKRNSSMACKDDDTSRPTKCKGKKPVSLTDALKHAH